MKPARTHESSLRILHLNSMLKGGGTDDRSVRIAHALLRLGHTVWMAGPAGREFTTLVEQLGLPFHPTPLGPIKLPFIFSIARFIRRERIQIVHARHGRDYWPAILAARLSWARPKIVLSRQLAHSPTSWFTRRFLLSQCDAFLPCSQFVAKVLREGVYEPESDDPQRRSRPPMLGDLSKIHVVYGGFDMKRFQPGDAKQLRREWGLGDSDFAFAVVGAYNSPRGKGQRGFLQAAAGIHEAVPRARFLIIGRGNMTGELQADIERLGLKGKAWLTPYCHDMPAGMNAIDCLVHPAVGTEALPGVVCEAHACGKPVIASRLDGVPEGFEAGGAYGQIVEPDSIEQLAGAMRFWAAQPPLDLPARWRIHEKVAERFSLERASSDLEKIYRSLLPNGDDRQTP